jgi:branched-subunit amino acid ABC-type transport system permease component
MTMTVTAIGSLLFGLAYLLIPASLASLYGIPLDSSDLYPRYFGSALIGFAAVLWLARKVPSGPALRAVLVGGFVASILGLLVAVFQALDPIGNTLEWSTVLIYFLLALGFGDFVFRTPPPR